MTSIDRSACPAPRHGTEHAYNDADCRCQDARDAFNAYRRGLRAGEHRIVDATRTRRQLQALAAAGYRWKDLAQELCVTPRTVAGYATRQRVNCTTQDLVDALTAKLQGPGPSPEASRRAAASGWLPGSAWVHGDINNPHRLAEVTALLGWLDNATDPLPALTVLMRRVDTLPLIARQITTRRAHALHARGYHDPAVQQGERIYQTERPIRLPVTRTREVLAA